MTSLLTLFVHACILIGVNSMLQPKRVKDTYENSCLHNAVFNFNSSSTNYLEPKCQTLFMDKYTEMKNFLNYTDMQMNYLYSLERAVLRKYEKKQNGRHKRQTGMMARQECRTLSDGARGALFGAIVDLKTPTGGMSRYDTIAGMHSFAAYRYAHLGPSFLGWHREYLIMYEEALQEIRSDVVLCYWDSTLDFLMPGSTQRFTVAFSADLFGNGRGNVINGAFANWQLPGGGTLRRNIAGDRFPGPPPSLTRPGIVDLIATDPSITSHTQIVRGGTGFTDPDTGRVHTWEQEHDNTHVWVGEIMQDVVAAPGDPVFFFHHTFIDYGWELFRQKINPNGNIDLRNDYPNVGGFHAPDAPMFGFQGITNRDGYSDEYTRMYAPHPTCSNGCGGSTQFLYCPDGGPMANPNRRCISRDINSDLVPAAAVAPAAAMQAMASGPEATMARFGPAATMGMFGPAATRAGFSPAATMSMFGPAASRALFGPAAMTRAVPAVGSARVSVEATDAVAVRSALSEPPPPVSGISFESSFSDSRL
uniref:Tyrosinase-like protein 1 n=1 Tax=Pinctada fucata TaxID=50426 RepID=A1IHF0_PINFU|nr:tyrosinase-like protein 1 [Pinctada fucata]